MSEPRTAAGRAHLSTFVSNQHHDNVDAAYECDSNIDRCDFCGQESDDILAIEAEAAQDDPNDLATPFARGYLQGQQHPDPRLPRAAAPADWCRFGVDGCRCGTLHAEAAAPAGLDARLLGEAIAIVTENNDDIWDDDPQMRATWTDDARSVIAEYARLAGVREGEE